MSRIFSISMATVLMLISFAGSVQPTTINDEVPAEIAAPTPDQDQPDSEHNVVEEVTVPAPQPVEVTPEEPDADEVTTDVDPTSDANAPPKVDVETESVGEITNASSSMVFVPNAIDPNPIDCGGIEQPPCPGGGDTQPLSVALQALTYVNGTTNTVAGVKFVVRDGTTLVGEYTGDQNGRIELQLVSGRTYSVVVSASGFDTEPAYSITPSSNSTHFEFLMFKSAPVSQTVRFEVVDAGTLQPIPDAEIRIVVDRTWSHADSGFSGADGTWSSKELAEGNYWADVFHDDFHDQVDIELNVPVSGTVQVKLNRIQRSPISLKFVDADTGDPVEGAFFILARQGWGLDVEDVSSPGGEYTTGNLDHGTYVISVWAQGYGYVYDLRWDHPHNGTFVIELNPHADGTITIIALDEDTMDPVPNANITLFEGDFETQVMIGQTDAQGIWTSPVLPGGYYTASIYAAEHHAAYPEMSVVNGNTTYTVLFMAFNDIGRMDVYVVESIGPFGNTNEIRNARVTVYEKNRGFIAQGFTDSDGYWPIQYLPSGTYVFTVEKTGYYKKTVELAKTRADTTLEIELERPGQSWFKFWILIGRCDCGGGKHTVRSVGGGLSTTNGLIPMAFQTVDDIVPLAGVTARLIDPYTMEVLSETTSDADGLVDFGEVYEGTYILELKGDEIEDYSATIELTGDLELNFLAEPTNDENGNGDGTTPGNDDDNGNGDGTTPGNGDDNGNGDGTTPGDGDENGNGDGTTPGNGDDDDNGNDDDTTNPGNGDDDGNGNGDGTTPDNEPGTDGDVTSESGDAATASGNPNSSPTVSQLPNTGIGDSDSHVGIAALTFVMVFAFLSALGVRRKS